jgi:hypothetical protein
MLTTRRRIRLSDLFLAAFTAAAAVLAGVMLAYVAYVLWMLLVEL